jgi:Cys-rich repeat protein
MWCDFRDTCVPHGTGDCRTAADCASGNLCIEGQCTQLANTCQYDYDCPAGTACVNAQCTSVCTADTDCASGDVCDTTHHFCHPAQDCSTTAQCTTGEHCVDGRCLADCHGGAACPTSTRQTSYCGGDSFCHPSWQPAPFCTSDSQCATGRHCLNHVCRTPCPTMMDSECATIDSTLPYCLLDAASGQYLCNATMSSTPQCRTSADCSGATPDCVNASCR